MNIQIVGTRKNADTRKCERFFRERGVHYHFVDLAERGLSPGELERIIQAVGVEELIDTASKAYSDRGLAYMDFDPVEEVLRSPLLLRQPVVRDGRRACVGYDETTWTGWIDEERKG